MSNYCLLGHDLLITACNEWNSKINQLRSRNYYSEGSEVYVKIFTIFGEILYVDLVKCQEESCNNSTVVDPK